MDTNILEQPVAYVFSDSFSAVTKTTSSSETKHTSAKLPGTQPEIREFVANISKNIEFHIQQLDRFC
jgi:hypothetical protein